MMARIGGDTEDLPAGWTVDQDNWGTRPGRPGDVDRMKAEPGAWTTACEYGGRVFVMDARTARLLDGVHA